MIIFHNIIENEPKKLGVNKKIKIGIFEIKRHKNFAM